MSAPSYEPAHEVSLPMYDFASVAEMNNVLLDAVQAEQRWHLSAEELQALTGHPQGQHSMPTGEEVGCDALWSSKSLLWTHICGLPLTAHHPDLVPAGAITYAFDGCDTTGTYTSLLVVKAAEAHLYPSVAALGGAKLAVNSLGSWTGAVSLRCAVERLVSGYTANEGSASASGSSIDLQQQQQRGPHVFFDPDVLVTGSHLESLRAVRDNTEPVMDCAAIDCITWGLVAKHAPAELRGLAVVGRTEPMPAPPIAVRRDVWERHGPALAAAMRAVFTGAPRSASTLADVRRLRAALDGLCITGFVFASRAVYDAAFAEASTRAARVPLVVAYPSVQGQVQSLHDQYFARLDAAGYAFPVTTASAEAQCWMNRGMLLGWGFQFEQARAAFERVLQLEPAHVMAHWGVVAVSGVNYNYLVLDEADVRRCRQHVDAYERKLAAGARATPLERRLCAAMAVRCVAADEAYPCTDMEGTQALLARHNAAYADAMRILFEDCRERPELGLCGGKSDRLWLDVTALFVEALMNLRPWQLWPAGQGHLQRALPPADEALIEVHADTLLAQRALEEALADMAVTGACPHPGVSHYFVHLMELAPLKSMVARARGQADVLRRQWPACGHLLHMASHIDVQVGAYAAGCAANVAGIAQDIAVEEATQIGRDTYYHGYRLHNHHMLVYCAMLQGRFDLALSSAEEANASTPPSLLDKWLDYLEPYVPDPWMVLVRFGRWHDILTRALPADFERFAVTFAFGLYAKGLAHSALGQVREAKETKALFDAAAAAVPASRMHHNVPCSLQMQVAVLMLQGELAYREAAMALEEEQGVTEAALEALQGALASLWAAVAREDALPYDEPWGWMVPVRHAIGALALEQALALAGKGPLGEAAAPLLLEESERAYREDLQIHPDNVWALLGLSNCLAARTSSAGALRSCSSPESESVASAAAVQAEVADVTRRLGLARQGADPCVRGMQHSCFCAGNIGPGAATGKCCKQ